MSTYLLKDQEEKYKSREISKTKINTVLYLLDLFKNQFQCGILTKYFGLIFLKYWKIL